MKKRLLLIGYNFFPEPTGIGKYSGEMVDWFVRHGYDCTVITSYPYYPFWKVQEPYYKKRFRYSVEKTNDAKSGGSLRVYRCPQYVPSSPSGLKRMLLEVSFFVTAFFPLLKLLFSRKFDFVMTVAPSFQVGLFGIIFKKIHKAKFLYHIQDLQIEAAQDLNLIKSKRILGILYGVEKYIFNNADVISTISPGMVGKVKNKAKKEVVLFPNWTDIKAFHPVGDKAQLRKKFSYHPSDKIVLYSGAIGEKQGLDSLLAIADRLRSVKNLKFIICGSGPYKAELQSIAERLKLENVNFMPLQSHVEFNNFLNLADIHLVIQKASATDLVMPSKLSTILAVGGLAIITANPGSGLYTLIKEHEMGVLVSAEDTDQLQKSIMDIINNDYSYINTNARRYAEEHLPTDKILLAYESFIQNRAGGDNISRKVSAATGSVTSVAALGRD